ncbi:sigma-70 family RNA polymerase sigma factor [Oscillatoria sp. FACHB-1407]|uniref:sigma-70 family RNA polymerase sigma factor n=1 Tax=Oscillatoria sp. FACHB-1407 TaxID=2692847 RepID=UPI0016883324|nr:sigma-70 family RNA polymerase sigma factor [Oscillatoria sp. FACHB-1407]MBD2461119.1 sigma-70 family RNA polymerase sigma factor [Oscillatoria sp. FACHB-1407]
MHSDAAQPESTANPQLSDLDLLNALREGQLNALGILYDRYASLVYGLALRILSNSEEAEDVTQDVFLTLWHRDAYNPARGSLSSFLITMARSRSIDRLRSRQTRTRFFQRWGQTVSTETSATPLEQATLKERSQRVRDALGQLPEPERQVLEIAYYEGLSQSEIAKRLNTPLGTVKTRSRQGLLRLRRLLQDFIQ